VIQVPYALPSSAVSQVHTLSGSMGLRLPVWGVSSLGLPSVARSQIQASEGWYPFDREFRTPLRLEAYSFLA